MKISRCHGCGKDALIKSSTNIEYGIKVVEFGEDYFIYDIQHPTCSTCKQRPKGTRYCDKTGNYVDADFYCKDHEEVQGE